MYTLSEDIRVALLIIESMDSPLSEQLVRAARKGDWGPILHSKVDPRTYPDAFAYYSDAQATSLLRKCKNLPGGPSARSRSEAAKVKWLTAERQCLTTNQRFSDYICGYYPDVDPHIVEYLDRVKKRIAFVLGRLPADLDGRHGKGATYHDRGTNCTVLHKMQSRPTMTNMVSDLLPLIERSAWFRAVTNRYSSAALVRGNRFTTVPKTTVVDRAIAVEPSVNVWFQLGLGRCIRRQLKRRAGIDLDNGQSTHRMLAREGSIHGNYATLDLSNASDTVAYRLVKYLLPDDWFSVLDSLRSPTTMVDGKHYVLEKFSSMGNGFTFELETLIFWAIAQELCPSQAYVYGDDIIVPTESALNVWKALEFCGFTINTEKTFLEGPFRESCGGDYFNGVDVRPYFIKELPHEPEQWIGLANGITTIGDRRCDGILGAVPSLRAAHRACLEQLPSHIRRLKGPRELGDTVIWDPDVSSWSVLMKHGIRYVHAWVPMSRSLSIKRFDPDVQLAGCLYGVPSDGVALRDAIAGYVRRPLAFS